MAAVAPAAARSCFAEAVTAPLPPRLPLTVRMDALGRLLLLLLLLLLLPAEAKLAVVVVPAVVLVRLRPPVVAVAVVVLLPTAPEVLREDSSGAPGFRGAVLP